MKHRTFVLFALLLVASCAGEAPQTVGRNWAYIDAPGVHLSDRAKVVATETPDGRIITFGCYGTVPIAFAHIPGVETKVGGARAVSWRVDSNDRVEEQWRNIVEVNGSFWITGDPAMVIIDQVEKASSFMLSTDQPTGLRASLTFRLSDFGVAIAKVREVCGI